MARDPEQHFLPDDDWTAKLSSSSRRRARCLARRPPNAYTKSRTIVCNDIVLERGGVRFVAKVPDE
jgi:hypothetical protein